MPKFAFTCYCLLYVPANPFTSTNFTHLQSCLAGPFHVCSNFSREFATNANIKPGGMLVFSSSTGSACESQIPVDNRRGNGWRGPPPSSGGLIGLQIGHHQFIPGSAPAEGACAPGRGAQEIVN